MMLFNQVGFIHNTNLKRSAFYQHEDICNSIDIISYNLFLSNKTVVLNIWGHGIQILMKAMDLLLGTVHSHICIKYFVYNAGKFMTSS